MGKATVVLVHGAWADGSGFQAVYEALTSDGHDVRVVQNPTTSLADDDTVTRNQLDAVDGPVVLVGHSYGGAVITEAGTHDKVAALVYLTAFAPDAGESVSSLIATFPTTGPQPPILPPVNGFILLDREKFPADFAGDVAPELSHFMADAQVPWGVPAFQGTITTPAWKSKPVWYLHVTDDRMIPPAEQERMAQRMGATIVSVPGNHAIYVSDPDACVALIRTAIDAVAA